MAKRTMTPRELSGSFKASTRHVDVAGGNTVLLVSSNPDRVFLMIGILNAGTAQISNLSDVDATNGFTLTGSAPILKLSVHEAPALVAEAWYCHPAFGINTVEVCEVVPTGAGQQPEVS